MHSEPAIVSLAERPDLAAVAAGWIWDEWGRNMPAGASLAALTALLKLRQGPAVPQSFVLLDSGIPAAAAALVAADLEARPDLSPWLAEVYVLPAFRGRGHAVRLVRRVEGACRAAGIATLWLNTAHAAGLYARLGWQEAGEARHNGHPVTIMRRDLL
jgi:GNAT superfamily N-acetyltransferase